MTARILQILPPHTIPLVHHGAPAPSFLYPASNLDWRFVRRGPVHTAWRGAKTTPGPLCWTRRQSEGPVHHPRVGPPPSACGRTKPSLKAAEPDGTFLGGKGWGRGRWRAGGSRPPAWSPELRQARDGYLGTRSGAVPGSPSCRPGSTCRFFLVSGGRRRSYKQREHGVGGPSVLW